MRSFLSRRGGLRGWLLAGFCSVLLSGFWVGCSAVSAFAASVVDVPFTWSVWDHGAGPAVGEYGWLTGPSGGAVFSAPSGTTIASMYYLSPFASDFEWSLNGASPVLVPSSALSAGSGGFETVSFPSGVTSLSIDGMQASLVSSVTLSNGVQYVFSTYVLYHGASTDNGLSIYPVLSATAASGGSGVLAVSVTGGVAPYTVDVGGHSLSLSSESGTVDVADLPPGAVSGTVTDSSGSVVDVSGTVVVSPVVITSGVSGGSVALTVSGGSGPYKFSIGSQSQTLDAVGTAVFSSVPDGDYYARVSGAYGGSASVFVAVGSPPAKAPSSTAQPLAVTLAPEPTYVGGSISGGVAPYTVASGGTDWPVQGDPSFDVTGLKAGDSGSVTVTDFSGASVTEDFTTPSTYEADSGLSTMMGKIRPWWSVLGDYVVWIIIAAMGLGVLVIGAFYLWRLLRDWLRSAR